MKNLPAYAIVLILIGTLLIGIFIGTHISRGHMFHSRMRHKSHMKHGPKGMHGRKGKGSHKGMAKMHHQLNLTTDQREKIADIIHEQRKLTMKDSMANRDKIKNKISQILTPEQQKKLKERSK